MCIEPTGEDFTRSTTSSDTTTTSGPTGSSRSLFHNGANDGFHEAIGDTIALSITPEYLQDRAARQGAGPVERHDPALARALDKVAFLPFGLSDRPVAMEGLRGEDHAGDYNDAWWDLRKKYQGVAPPRRARGSLRSRRQVPRAGQHAVHTIFPRGDPPVPVPSCDVPQTRATRVRSIAARSTEQKAGEKLRRRCWRWVRASRGPRRSTR